MDEEPRRSTSPKPFPGLTAAGPMATEEGDEPKKSGADFYLKKLQMMDAMGDPMLGKSFTLDSNADDQDAVSQMTNLTTEQKIRDRNPKNKATGLKEVVLLNLRDYGQERFMSDCWPGVSEALISPMPALQEASLEVLCKVLSEPTTQVWLEPRDVMKTLVEKTLPNLKPNFKKLLVDCTLRCFKKLGKDALYDCLKENLGNKNPKIKGGLIRLLTDILQHVGLKEFSALKYWEILAKDIDSVTAPAVKKEFVTFSVELHRWFGDSFTAKLAVLKKFTLDEIQKQYDDLKKADQATLEKDPSAQIGVMPILEEYQGPYKQQKTEGGAGKQTTADNYDDFDAVDVYKGFGEKWTEKVLEKEKWIEKRDMVQEFLNLAACNPKHTGSYFPCIQLAKRLLDDSNLAVQTQAVRMLGAMAKGLRKDMAKDSKKVVNLLLPKLKERKKTFTDEVVESLRSTLYFTMPQDCQADYEELLAIKNNTLLKQNILEWFINVAEREPANRLLGFISGFKSAMVKLMEEGAKEIRDLNLALIAKLNEKIPADTHKDLNDIIEKLPKAQAEKLRNGGTNGSQFLEEKLASRGALGSASKMRDSSRGSFGNSSKQNSPSPSRPGSLMTQSKVSVKPFGSSKMAIGSSVSQFRKPGDNVKESGISGNTVGGVGSGFAEVRIGDVKPENALIALSAKGITIEAFNAAMAAHWKQKQEFLETLRGVFCDPSTKPTQEEYAAVGILLINLLKLFKESNPLLLKDYQTLASDIFEAAGKNDQDSLGGKFIYSFGWYLVEKYGDAKLVDKQKEVINSLTPKNVSLLILSLCELVSSKAPAVKAYQSILQLMSDLVEKHHKNLPKREIVALARESCCHANTAVRDESINLICVLAKYIGDSIKKMVNELKNPQVKKMIEVKLEKVQPVAMDIEESPNGNGQTRNEVPKKDISSQITKLMPQFRDGKWLTRRDSLIEATRIIRNANRIMSKGLTDFGTVLKERLTDSNSSVSKEALTLLMSYSKALGSDFRGQVKLLLPHAVPFMNDKLEVIRDITKSVFENSIIGAGADVTLPVLLKALGDPNPEVVIRVFDFLARENIHKELRKGDQKVLAKAIVTNLIHKSQQVRAAAERLLELICTTIPREGWLDAQRDLNPSTRLITESLLNKYLPEQSTLSNSQMPTRMDIETPLGDTVHQSMFTMDRQLRRVKNNADSMMFGYESIASVSRGSTPGSKMSLTLPMELQNQNVPRMVMSQYPAQSSQHQGMQLNQQKLARSTSMQEGLASLTGSGEKRNDPYSSKPHRNMVGGYGNLSMEGDILLTWEEPRDDEITQVRERLATVFGEPAMEKMMSNEQPKLIESLTNLDGFRTTNPEKYRQLLNLLFNWMYLRVFDTTRKTILELLGEFLVSCLQDFVSRGVSLPPETFSRLYRVFERIINNYPSKEECTWYIQKCGTLLAQTAFNLEFFSYLVEHLTPTSSSDTNLIANLLSHMAASIDITKALSLRSICILEDFTTQLPDLRNHEMFNFYSAAYKALGSQFFNVFRFRQQEQLQKYFGSPMLQLNQPLPEVLGSYCDKITRRVGERMERVKSLQGLLSVIDSILLNPSLAAEIEQLWGSVAAALTCCIEEFHLMMCQISPVEDLWFSETCKLISKLCIPVLKFVGRLNNEQISDILNKLLESLLHFHRLGQGKPPLSDPTSRLTTPQDADRFKQLGTKIHEPIFEFIRSLPFDTAFKALLTLVRQNLAVQSEQQQDADLQDHCKKKMTVVLNAFGILNKGLPAALLSSASPAVNVAACLVVADEFFQNFTEDSRTNLPFKYLRNTLKAFCNHYKEQLLDFMVPKGVMVPENLYASIRPAVMHYLNELGVNKTFPQSTDAGQLPAANALKFTVASIPTSLQGSATKKTFLPGLSAQTAAMTMSPRANLLPALLLGRIRASPLTDVFSILNGERKRICPDTLQAIVEALQREGEAEKANRVKQWDDEEKENRDRLDNDRPGFDQIHRTAEKVASTGIQNPTFQQMPLQSSVQRGPDFSQSKLQSTEPLSNSKLAVPFSSNQVPN